MVINKVKDILIILHKIQIIMIKVVITVSKANLHCTRILKL